MLLPQAPLEHAIDDEGARILGPETRVLDAVDPGDGVGAHPEALDDHLAVDGLDEGRVYFPEDF